MRVGVCSWSLQPTSPADLVEKVRACGLSRVQLALNPILAGEWDLKDTISTLQAAGVDVLSTMAQTEGEDYTSLESIRHTGGLRPDEHWEANLAMAQKAAALTHDLGVDLVTFHAGFIPHDPDESEYPTILDRVRTFSLPFHERGIRVALETGQEDGTTLVRFLSDLDDDKIGVNFDPANMILYGMGDPVDALTQLAPSVFQIHLKDADASSIPNQWGTEVPVGKGQVRWDSFFDAVESKNVDVHFLFEREAGETRVGDIKQGLEALRPLLHRCGASV